MGRTQNETPNETKRNEADEMNGMGVRVDVTLPSSLSPQYGRRSWFIIHYFPIFSNFSACSLNLFCLVSCPIPLSSLL
jgi:hypothetical protein